MAGNSWIYMPGFFATAAAIWLHARRASPREAFGHRAVAGLIAVIVAIAAGPAGSSSVIRAFREVSGLQVADIRYSSPAALLNGTYTLFTWSVFVIACRAALTRRTLRPFAAPALLSIGLALLRPWTVDDFVDDWVAGVTAGGGPATLSLALIFVVTLLLLACERQSAQPQPREMAVHDGNSPSGQHEQQIGGDRKQVETG